MGELKISREEARKLLDELEAQEKIDNLRWSQLDTDSRINDIKRRQSIKKIEVTDKNYSIERNELFAETLKITACVDELKFLFDNGFYTPKDLSPFVRSQIFAQVREAISLLKSFETRMEEYDALCEKREAQNIA